MDGDSGMKIGKLALACAIACALQGGRLYAQQPTGDQNNQGLNYPAGRLVGYEYTKYYAPTDGASPSDATATPEAAATVVPAEEKAAAPAEVVAEEEADEWVPKHILGNVPFLKKRGIEVGGWIAQGFVANPQSPQDKFNGPVTWMDRSNEYMLNEVWTYVGKAATNDGEGLALGYRLDLLYGESARLTTSSGLEDKINKSQSFYGLAIPNAYIDVAYNDLKMKVGHWISPVGYYTVGTYMNFFNTIPYTYQWGEPFTHTGVLPAYQATDNLVIGTGFTKGWDNTGNFNPHMGYIGTATLSNILKEGDSFAYVQMFSEEPNGSYSGNQPSANAAYAGGKPNFSGRYFQTCVYSAPLSEKWTYVAQSDFGYQNGATTATGNTKARWYGLNQYLYYKVSDKLAWGFNFEWFRDEEGFRVGGFLPNYANDTNGGTTNTRGWGSNGGGAFAGGFAGNFQQITFGPRWNPYKNLVIRPNARFDWYNGANGTVSNGTTQYLHPYDSGTRNQQGILMTDMIIVF
jgi:hypothetical protein